MKRLYLTVEGQTEAVFARDVLTPHLSLFQVYLSNPRFTGAHGRRGGRVPRGGMFKFLHALEDMRRWMKEDQSPDARFSMMVDLYGLPKDCPGYEAAMKETHGFERAKILEEAIHADLSDDRFVPYIQVHEFEALVLSDPTQLKSLYEGRDAEIDDLTLVCSSFSSPEEIDQGRETHPKERIRRAVNDYDENVSGPLLAHDIGLTTLRASCPHFGQWLDRLERLDEPTL